TPFFTLSLHDALPIYLLLVLLIHLTVSAFSLHVALFLLFSELPLLTVVFLFYIFQKQPFVLFFLFLFAPNNHHNVLYKSSAAHRSEEHTSELQSLFDL